MNFAVLFRHRPAFTAFISLASGIILADALNIQTVSALRAMFCIALAVCALLFIYRKKTSRYPFLIVALLCVGFLMFSISERAISESPLGKFAETGIQTNGIGRIEQKIESRARTTYIVECTSIRTGETKIEKAGRFALVMSDSIRLDRGMTISFTGTLTPIEENRNPYQFNYLKKLQRAEHLSAVFYLNKNNTIQKETAPAKLSIWESVQERADVIREELLKQIYASLGGDSSSAGFIGALLLGERHGVLAETWDDFQRAGLSHILVVSGFNLGVIALVFYYILRLFGVRSRVIRIWSTIAVVISYGLLVGGEPSLFRAGVVIVFILFAKLLERKYDLVNLTASAACISMLLNPFDLFDIGYQLSYMAVFSLAVIAPRLDSLTSPQQKGKKHSRVVTAMLTIFIPTFAVYLGTLPIVAFHSHQLPLFGLVLNILIIPLSALITALGLLIVPIHLGLPSVASVYADALHLMTTTIHRLTDAVVEIPLSTITVTHPSLLFLLLYCTAVWYLLGSTTRGHLGRRVVVCLTCVAMLYVTTAPLASKITSDGMTVTFFDVGQGDAILISTPSGKNYLVDCGGLTYGGTPRAKTTILPFLKAEGIHSIDGLFLTHLHTDHIGGAVQLEEEGYINHIYTCGERSGVATARKLDSLVQISKTSVSILSSGDKIVLDDDVVLYVLNPERSERSNEEPLDDSEVNHRSLAMKLTYGTTDFLLLGDVEAEDERRFVTQYGSFLSSEVVKVAHHGSSTSSSHELINTVNAEYAVISVGRNNRFGHPRDEVVHRWITSGVKILRTDKDGAQIFHSDGNVITKAVWR